MLFDGNSQRYIAPKNVELTFDKAYDKKKKNYSERSYKSLEDILKFFCTTSL